MTQTAQTPPYKLEYDEKAVPVMVYTASAFYWGEAVVKEVIRVSTWLRTNAAPDRFRLYNAKAILTAAGAAARPIQFTELYIATSQVLIFHLVPPTRDPLDYDPSEPNRHMVPVSVLVGTFRVDGSLRLSMQSTLGKFLEITREPFSAIYDARVSNPANPAFGMISVPYLLARQEVSVFGV